ncbi:MAG: bifunctional 4-hydroxy-2-oxoglutarate aldolase/2-dehydro-3-deoxy-phosphogluconate aldolase, partial [Chitinophagaceae bacterium]
MKTTQQVIDAIVGQGMLPLYFHPNEEKSSAILRALYRSGVRAIEYTNRGASAHSNFKKLIEIRNTEMQDLTLGIGTIKNLQQAKDYLAVGADFLVSPGYDAEVAAYCVERDLFFGPGCMSPT